MLDSNTLKITPFMHSTGSGWSPDNALNICVRCRDASQPASQTKNDSGENGPTFSPQSITVSVSVPQTFDRTSHTRDCRIQTQLHTSELTRRRGYLQCAQLVRRSGDACEFMQMNDGWLVVSTATACMTKCVCVGGGY